MRQAAARARLCAGAARAGVVAVGTVWGLPAASAWSGRLPALPLPSEEAFYVLEGAPVETPDGKPMTLATGVSRINVRDVPHGAFKVTGDKQLKLLTVHIVDKGKPMFVPVKP